MPQQLTVQRAFDLAAERLRARPHVRVEPFLRDLYREAGHAELNALAKADAMLPRFRSHAERVLAEYDERKMPSPGAFDDRGLLRSALHDPRYTSMTGRPALPSGFGAVYERLLSAAPGQFRAILAIWLCALGANSVYVLDGSHDHSADIVARLPLFGDLAVAVCVQAKSSSSSPMSLDEIRSESEKFKAMASQSVPGRIILRWFSSRTFGVPRMQWFVAKQGVASKSAVRDDFRSLYVSDLYEVALQTSLGFDHAPDVIDGLGSLARDLNRDLARELRPDRTAAFAIPRLDLAPKHG